LSKARLRTSLRERRQRLDQRQRASAGRQLCRRFAHIPLFRRSRSIAFYWAVDGEIDLGPLMNIAWRAGKTVYLPGVLRDRTLEFRELRPGDRMVGNAFGIPEPPLGAPASPLERLDLILTPLVAFDNRGFRLGMGGGYYDRTLDMARGRNGRARAVGAAYSFQQVEQVPAEPWDRPLRGVVTERGYRALPRDGAPSALRPR